MNESSFQEALQSAVQSANASALRRVILAGRAAGHSLEVPLVNRSSKGRKRVATALHIAATSSDVVATEVLLEYGANVNARDVDGCTPLHLAIERTESGRDRVIALLLQHGADPNATNSKNETPLHYVMVVHSNLTWTKTFNVGALPPGGIKRAQEVIKDEMSPITRQLMAAGSDPDFVPEGVRGTYRTPFQLAVYKGVTDQVRLLIEEYGVRASQKTRSNKSMLAIAGNSTVQNMLRSYIATEVVADAIGEDPVAVEAPRASRGSLSL